MFNLLKSRPSSPKNTRQAPTAPVTAPKVAAPTNGYPSQQQQSQNQMNYSQYQPNLSLNNSSIQMNITPANLMSAFQTATNLTNTFNSIKDKVQPPNRPAPMPNSAQSNLPNPMIPTRLIGSQPPAIPKRPTQNAPFN